MVFHWLDSSFQRFGVLVSGWGVSVLVSNYQMLVLSMVMHWLNSGGLYVKFTVAPIPDMSNGKFGIQCQCQWFWRYPFSMPMSMPMFLLEGFLMPMPMSILFQVLYQCQWQWQCLMLCLNVNCNANVLPSLRKSNHDNKEK